MNEPNRNQPAFDDIDVDIADLADDDIAALEDPKPITEEVEAIPIPADFVMPTQLYRIKLHYSNETFLAFYEGDTLNLDQVVIAPTRYGKDLCLVIGKVVNPGPVKPNDLIKIERIAQKADFDKAGVNAAKETEALRICREKISAHHLDMKLVSVHYLLEESKILFFFTAESRVDFRDLVKDLVGIFKTRIELRQIGVRDESGVVGGLGVCGRIYCCHAVSDKPKPVSIKMAKDQNLSLNSMKISGPCGRLLCCLAYEHSFYHEERRSMPPEGCRLVYQGINWKVVEVNPIVGRLKISGEDGRIMDVASDRFERFEGRWRLKEEGQAIPPSANGHA